MRTLRPSHENMLMVSSHASDVGYAWWLMESFWAAIARHYATRGRRSFLVFPRISSISDRIAQAPIEVAELDFQDRSAAGLRRLRDYVREHRIGVVYLTDAAYVDRLYARLRLWGVRRIIDHDHFGDERPPAATLRRLVKGTVHRIGLASCDHYIAVSRFIHRRFLSHVCVPPSKCSPVINGIVPIEPDVRCRSQARSEFGIPDQATVIVSTGRASHVKGIPFIVECAHTLIRERGLDDLWFLHCGDGPNFDEFRRLVTDRGLDGRFIFAGRRNDVRCILQACDIGIQASVCEAFSLSILEYMSAGLATLAPAVCGNPEAIDSGQTGYLYPARDRAEVVRLIESLHRDRATRARLGDAARRAVLERFTLDRCNRDLIATLDAVIGDLPAGPVPSPAVEPRLTPPVGPAA